MFLFQISNYDSPTLDAEAAELFRQRLEDRSRRMVPWMWKATDRLNAYAAKDRAGKCGGYVAAFMALSCWLWVFLH